jgi:large subunit ribosomal protein L22
MITASLKNYRISPRKFRLVADMVRGKGVVEAKSILTHVIKKAKNPLSDLLDSAIANASNNHKIEKDTLFIKEIRVDQGYVLKRSQPMSRGTAFPIKKRTSHVHIVLAPLAQSESRKSIKSVKSGSKDLENKKIIK